jgi:hypothetical protein
LAAEMPKARFQEKPPRFMVYFLRYSMWGLRAVCRRTIASAISS